MKKLIVFDLDGTLAESKAPLDAEIATLLSALLSMLKVAIISPRHEVEDFVTHLERESCASWKGKGNRCVVSVHA